MYDFTTVKNRGLSGSGKWQGMKKTDGSAVTESGIVPLSVADMEFVNAPEILAALHRCVDEMTPYGYQSATDEYLQAVVGWMHRRHHWEIDPSWIVISPGVVKALNSLVKTFTQPGEGVVLMTPVYYPFYSAAACNETHVVESPLVLQEDHYEIDFADLEKQLSDPKNTVLILCSPHNPIGKVFSRDELLKIGELALKYEVLVIADEIHNDLIMPGYEHTVYATLGKEFEKNCVVCTSPSKTFNLAGMINANIIIPDEKRREQYLKGQGFININPFSMKACIAAYNDAEPWLEALLQVLDSNVSWVYEFMDTYFKKAIVHKLQGTYLLWIDFRAYGLDQAELEKVMKDEALLFLDEGYMFGEAGSGFERVNLAVPMSVVQASFMRLKTAFEKRGLI